MADSNAKKLAQFLTASGTYNLYDVQADSTGFFDLPTGTTAQRPTPTGGMIRFNSTLNLAEYYDGSLWKAIDSPPTVSSISPETFSASGTTITITGQNFQSGVNVKLIDTDGTELTPDSVTLVSSSSITFDTTQAMVDNEKDKFDVRVTNTSGLSGTLDNILEISDGTFSFTSSATSNLYDSGRSSGFDAGGSLSGGGGESDVTISYAVTSGSLPSGGSISSSTGSITGISAVGSDTVSNFTVTATVADASEGTSDTYTRAFALTVKAPVISSYTSTGSGTFSVPSGITAVDVLVVAGGGGGGTDNAGGGGAGGLIYRPAFPVTPGGSVSYSVGAGGGNTGQDFQPGTDWPQGRAQVGPILAGGNSTFGSLTAQGGGGGGSSEPYGTGYPGVNIGYDGGSGGGGAGEDTQGQQGGSGTQPQQPGDSGTYGFGNDGGLGYTNPNTVGGGGGAGAAGSNGNSPAKEGGVGGNGKQYDISGSQVYYAGGGGGGNQNSPAPGTNPAGGQGGGGNGGDGSTGGSTAGTANRGGGGGGGGSPSNTGPWGSAARGNVGGSGIVIVSY